MFINIWNKCTIGFEYSSEQRRPGRFAISASMFQEVYIIRVYISIRT